MTTPGGPKAKALVEKVTAALEEARSRGFDRAARAHLVTLKPDLDGLIKMSEVMAAAMKTQVDACGEGRTEALRSIGVCNGKKRDLEKRVDDIKKDIARAAAAADDSRNDVQKIRRQIEENTRESNRLREDEARAMGMMWGQPSNSMAAFARGAIEYCMQQQRDLQGKLKQAENRLNSANSSVRSFNDDIRRLGGEKDGVEREIRDLNGSIAVLDERSKAFAQRLVDFHEAKQFYGKLSNEIENLQGSLGSKMVAGLLESRNLVLISGDQVGRQQKSSLKEVLIHLGGEYDLYVQNGLPAITGIPQLPSKL